MKNDKAKSLRPISSLVPPDKPTVFQKKQAAEKSAIRQIVDDPHMFDFPQNTTIKTVLNHRRQRDISYCPGSREFAEQAQAKKENK